MTSHVLNFRCKRKFDTKGGCCSYSHCLSGDQNLDHYCRSTYTRYCPKRIQYVSMQAGVMTMMIINLFLIQGTKSTYQATSQTSSIKDIVQKNNGYFDNVSYLLNHGSPCLHCR